MPHRAVFEEHCARHELAIPVDAQGRPFWRPSARATSWRVSAGTGVVHATTTVRPRDGEPYDLSLVELDEGVRLLSRVEGLAPEAVRIGLRVRVAWTDDDVPVFVPDEG